VTLGPPHPDPAIDRDARFRQLVRASALKSLRQALRWATDRAATRYLRETLAALRRDALDLALRPIDRAWRTLPGATAVLAPVYGRLLVLEGRDPDAALGLLQRVSDPDPDVAALTVHALAQSGRGADAQRALHQALADYYVAPGGLLAHLADRAPPGSGADVPASFGLDGRAVSRGPLLRGWVRLGWRPSSRPRLRVADESGASCLVRTEAASRQGWRWPFALDLRRARLTGNRIVVAARLPDGRWQALPDAPLLREALVRPPARSRQAMPRWHPSNTRRPARGRPGRRPTDVIIPVYRGREDSLACIESVLGSVDRHTCVIVVDDATDDAELGGALAALAARQRITLLRNATNEGFVASVNRALGVHPAADAVLLNSDTRVSGDWLTRLRAAAYRDSRVGTVTPFTNSGSIAGYPRPGEQPLMPEDTPRWQEMAACANAGVSVEIPVGVGFCLYVRRDCLRETGPFDAAVFGSGYGEEVDFCLRARQRGWSHRLAADVFVHHSGAMSFGPRRAALLDRSDRLLQLRHPGFARFVGQFRAADPLKDARRRFDEQRLAALPGPMALLVTLALPGGVERFVTERCAALRAQGLTPLLLRPRAGAVRGCELSLDAIDAPNLRYEIPADTAALGALLARLAITAIEIQHFLHLDARVIEMVRALGKPCDVFIHDYAWICPRVTLIDGSGRYCGEPDVAVCATCVRRNGSQLRERITVPALRRRSARWLREARQVIAPSADTAQRLGRYFEGLEILVRPNAVPAIEAPLPPRAAARPRVRVATLGAIGTHKGYRVLLDCARDARRRRLPLEYVVIGHTAGDTPLLRTGRVFVTGPYGEGEARHLLQREQPDLVFLPSVWPETWSYTLDEALGARLPVVAFDLGAIAQRLRTARLGELLPPDLAPPQINDRLLRVAGRTRHPQDAAGARMKGSVEKNMNKPTAAEPARHDQLAASVQILPLPAGLYLFSVTAAPSAPRANGALQLPALHVGLGPGVSAGQVEFTAGPTTQGAWLFATTDLLVIRVNGTGTTLMLTSVRGPGGEALSIKVERLDARTEPAAMPPAPARIGASPPETAAAARSPGKRGNADGPMALPVQIGAHIRSRGDMRFTDEPWAGRIAPGLWIESFSVRPLAHFTAGDIEYKGLTGSGFETAWLSDEAMCGTKGMSVPLVGFAVRLKPGTATAAYDCEYSGYFKSGLTIGPLRNGAPCRSNVANDPLEGVQIRILRRVVAAKAAPAAVPGKRARRRARPGPAGRHRK